MWSLFVRILIEVFKEGGWAYECSPSDLSGFDKLLANDPTRMHPFMVPVLQINCLSFLMSSTVCKIMQIKNQDLLFFLSVPHSITYYLQLTSLSHWTLHHINYISPSNYWILLVYWQTHHCTIPLYRTIAPSYCTIVPSYRTIVPYHCTIVPYHRTVPLYYRTVPSYRTRVSSYTIVRYNVAPKGKQYV